MFICLSVTHKKLLVKDSLTTSFDAKTKASSGHYTRTEKQNLCVSLGWRSSICIKNIL